ncbi:MAG: HD domain-containing protein, partial [Nitrososphaeria archaeon]
PYKKEGLDRLEEISKYAGETVKFLYSEEKRKKFIDVIRFPADTRPGPNTSSLLIHSLTTSALASTHYINKNGVDENLVIIRLAAIFHDIGKLLNWRRHKEISSKKMEELFDTYVDGDARKLVLEASRLISDDKHSLREFLDYGDRKSSGLDRVIKLFIKIIKKSSLYSDLENCLKDYTKTDLEEAFKDWAFWEKYVKEELIKKLTEEFCKTASIIDKENLVFVEESKIVDEDVIFVRVDMRRIQQFIRLNDLWAMNGASRLIDLILYVGIPAYLVDFIKLPLENILYFGGVMRRLFFRES